MVNGGYMFEKCSVSVWCNEGDVRLNGSSGQWNQNLMNALVSQNGKIVSAPTILQNDLERCKVKGTPMHSYSTSTPESQISLSFALRLTTLYFRYIYKFSFSNGQQCYISIYFCFNFKFQNQRSTFVLTVTENSCNGEFEILKKKWSLKIGNSEFSKSPK